MPSSPREAPEGRGSLWEEPPRGHAEATAAVSQLASEEAWCWQFRLGTARPGEAPRETLARLGQAVRRWLRPEERTKEQILDVILQEQFLGALRADVRAWVAAREPRSSQEAGALAEACLQREVIHRAAGLRREKEGNGSDEKSKAFIRCPFPCPDCGEGFLRRCDLAAHRKSHMGEWPHQCPKCGRRFRKRSVLVNHQRTHLQDDRYKCPDCGQGFKWPGQLEMHRYSHMEEKPHTCLKCGESFNQRSHLLAHQGSHLGDAPYHCADCGKGFAQHPDLIIHRRSHTGDRPFHCAECGIGFGRSSDLRNHQSVHASQQPHKCPECGKGFRESAHLAAHRRSHGTEDFYLGLATAWTG
uniref:Uncharacterized protein n=1 Tax=Pelusios castaneus TaxID=367368 RepID=A0A8C8RPZ4_9SAUR